MVSPGHLVETRVRIAGVGVFLIGCGVLLVVGCSGGRSEAPQEEQGHTEVTKEQTLSDRCEGTRTVRRPPASDDLQERTYTTNDVSGCPKGGLLSGTNERDKLDGEDGDDEIRGLGAEDELFGGLGSDVIYGGEGDDFLAGGDYWETKDESSKDVLHGGPGKDYLTDFDGGDDVLYGGDGDDPMLWGGNGEDVFYGGDGNDRIDAVSASGPVSPTSKERDEIYCGEGKDEYIADKLDYVDSSCEVK